MSNALATIESGKHKSVLVDMADRFGMEPAAFEATVRATCGADKCTREEFAAFLLVAREHGLNPVLREIYAFPRRGGGIVPVVSIDGWVNLINSTSQCDGFDFDEDHDAQGKLISITCRMYRKDRSHPAVVTEYLEECRRPTEPWKMAHRMLRHKALIQAARYAFGFAGIYDEDEGARIAQMRDVTPETERPQREDYIEAEPANESANEPEKADAEPFFITDMHGERSDEPLSADEFADAVRAELDECSNGDQIESVLTYNSDGLDRLPEGKKELIGESIDAANKRARANAVENAAEFGDLKIPLEFGQTGAPREKAYYLAMQKAFNKADTEAQIRAIWKANRGDISKCSKHWQDNINEAAKVRVAALGADD